MYFKNVWKMVVIIVLSLVVFIPVAQAQQSYDITECYSFTSHTTLSEVPDLTIVGFDGKGIVRSNVENKVFDNFTLHWRAFTV